MVGGRHAGGVRRAVLALLALALLALPWAPQRHAAMAKPLDMPLAGHGLPMAGPCPDHAPLGHAALGHATDDPAPADRLPAGQLPGLPCCAAAPCAGLQGAPPPVPTAAPLLPAAVPGHPATPPGPPGRDIPPDPRPPRAG